MTIRSKRLKNSIKNVHYSEIYEENGGFDLKKLPKGKGRWGFNEMKRNKSSISHSTDGKSTFIVIPVNDKIQTKNRL